MIIEYEDPVSKIKKCLIIETTPASSNLLSDKNYGASDNKMSFKNYESLIQTLERQSKMISESKENLIKMNLARDEIEFKTLSETEDEGTITFDKNDTLGRTIKVDKSFS